MDKLLAGKICVVTGGSKGIGRAIVELFLREGGSRLLFLPQRGGGPRAASPPRPRRRRRRWLKWVSCDVTDEKAVNEAIEAIVAEAGRIDALVNNAGITRDGLVFRMSLEDWDDGPAYEPHEHLPRLPRRGAGT